ncbi:MAG: hypothetical protein WDW36_004329 [Sanguina aurantia]
MKAPSLLLKLQGHRDSVNCCAASAQQPHVLASGSEDGRSLPDLDHPPIAALAFWPCSQPSPSASSLSNPSPPHSTPGVLYAACGKDILCLDPRAGRNPASRYSHSRDDVAAIALSTRGSHLAAGDDAGEVLIVDLVAGRPFKHMRSVHPAGMVTSVAFSGRRQWEVVTGGTDSCVARYDYSRARCLDRWPMGRQELRRGSGRHAMRMAWEGVIAPVVWRVLQRMAQLGSCSTHRLCTSWRLQAQMCPAVVGEGGSGGGGGGSSGGRLQRQLAAVARGDGAVALFDINTQSSLVLAGGSPVVNASAAKLSRSQVKAGTAAPTAAAAAAPGKGRQSAGSSGGVRGKSRTVGAGSNGSTKALHTDPASANQTQDGSVVSSQRDGLGGAMRFKVSNSFREETEKDLQRRERRVCDASAQYQRQRGSDDQAASLSAMAQRHLQRLDASSRGGTPAGLGRPSPSQAPEHAQLQRQLETLAKMRGLEALLDPHRPTSPVAPGPHSPTSPTSAAADCSSTRVHTPSAATSHGPFTPTGCRTATHPGGTPVSPPGAVTSNGAGILTLPGASASPVRHRHRLGSACLTSPGCPLQPTSNSTSNPSSRPGTAMLPVTDFTFNDTSGGGGGRRCSYSRDSQHHDRGGPATQRQRLGTMERPPTLPSRPHVAAQTTLTSAGRGNGGRFLGRVQRGPERDPARHTTEALAFASEGNLRCVSRGSMRSHAGVPAQMRGSGRGAAAPAAVCAGDGTLNPGLISTWRRNLPDGAHAFTVTRGLVYSVFAEMDKDGTGILTYSGFEEAALNIGLREEQARGLFKSLDQRRCGYISVREWGSPRIERQILEFTRLYLVNTRGVTGRAAGVREVKSVQLAIQLAMAKMNLRGCSRSSSSARMTQAFAFIDRDRSGSLGKTEVEDAFAALGVYVTADVMERMMQFFDKDGNGTIDYSEFLNTLFPAYSKSYKPAA